MKSLYEVLVKQNIKNNNILYMYDHPSVDEDDIRLFKIGGDIKYENIRIIADTLKENQLIDIFGKDGIRKCLSFIYNIIDKCKKPLFDEARLCYDISLHFIYINLIIDANWTAKTNRKHIGYIAYLEDKKDWNYCSLTKQGIVISYNKKHDKFIKEISK